MVSSSAPLPRIDVEDTVMSTDAAAVAERLTNVHPEAACAGQRCVIHNPSDHHMRGWPLIWRNDRGIFERRCPHGIGHPDPDQFAFWRRAAAAWRPSIAADVIDDPYPSSNPYEGLGVHGCCSAHCCWAAPR